jgi:hypothetical protein
MPRIRVDRTDHQLCETGLDDFARARSGSSNRGAGLQRYIQGGVFWYAFAELPKALDFGVGLASAPVMTAGHNLVPDHQDCSDGRIRTRLAKAAARFR